MIHPRRHTLNGLLAGLLAGLLVAAAAVSGATTADAKTTNLERRNAGLYEVSPAMMRAIDVIVAEQAKMRRHRR